MHNLDAGTRHPAAAHAARLACSKKPLGTMEGRGTATLAVRASPSLKAISLNTYVRPCSFYPANSAEPTAADYGRLLKISTSMISTGRWAPWAFLPAMGRMGTVKGTPYCPVTTVQAALVISHLNGGGWGPPELRPGLPAILA
eukprot:16437054-Heterocapsa_arctica.AAC.1